MRDGVVQRRYKIAIFAYSTRVIDVLGGIRELPELLRTGLPELSAGGVTDTAGGFDAVLRLLEGRLKEFQYSPAPLVCHLTAGVCHGVYRDGRLAGRRGHRRIEQELLEGPQL